MYDRNIIMSATAFLFCTVVMFSMVLPGAAHAKKTRCCTADSVQVFGWAEVGVTNRFVPHIIKPNPTHEMCDKAVLKRKARKSACKQSSSKTVTHVASQYTYNELTALICSKAQRLLAGMPLRAVWVTNLAAYPSGDTDPDLRANKKVSGGKVPCRPIR